MLLIEKFNFHNREITLRIYVSVYIPHSHAEYTIYLEHNGKKEILPESCSIIYDILHDDIMELIKDEYNWQQYFQKESL